MSYIKSWRSQRLKITPCFGEWVGVILQLSHLMKIKTDRDKECMKWTKTTVIAQSSLFLSLFLSVSISFSFGFHLSTSLFYQTV